jgi:hypothetical protein
LLEDNGREGRARASQTPHIVPCILARTGLQSQTLI